MTISETILGQVVEVFFLLAKLFDRNRLKLLYSDANEISIQLFHAFLCLLLFRCRQRANYEFVDIFVFLFYLVFYERELLPLGLYIIQNLDRDSHLNII